MQLLLFRSCFELDCVCNGRCGDVACEAAADMMAKWVLPLAANTVNGGPQPSIPKKKGRGGRPRSHAACIILAEDLRKAIKRT